MHARLDAHRALLVNLEDCCECGVSGWGWQDNACAAAGWLVASGARRVTPCRQVIWPVILDRALDPLLAELER